MSSEKISRRGALAGAAGLGLTATTLAACGSGSGSKGASGSSGGSSAAAGRSLSATKDVPEGSGVILGDQQVVLTQPAAGQFKCFSAICTHQGCVVADVTATIDCACHGSKFSIKDGSVVHGPATQPLGEKAITVKGGEITLA